MLKSKSGSPPLKQSPAKSGNRSTTQLRRLTVTEMTLEALREKILHGDYPEGTPLRQDAIATELGVSRIPVREALRQLEAEGLITLNPHHGATVSTLSVDEIRELFELRALIESDLLRRAIPQITQGDLDRAALILDRYEAAFEEHDVAAWGALNWQFHNALLASASRPLTMSVAEGLHTQSDRYTRLQLSLTGGQGQASHEHRAILEAVRNREADLASALLTAHITGAGRSLVNFLREHRAESEEVNQ